MSKKDDWEAVKKLLDQLAGAKLQVRALQPGQVPSVEVSVIHRRLGGGAHVEGELLREMLEAVVLRHADRLISDLIGEVGHRAHELQEAAMQEARELLAEGHKVADAQPQAGEEGEER